MRILVTGATGLVGRRLVLDRLERGDQVVIVSRRAAHAAAMFASSANPNVEVVAGNPSIPGMWQGAIDGTDAVVHLAGAGIGDRRWTRAYKRLIVESRVDGTYQVIEAIRRAGRRPRVLVCASAVGWYGDTGDRETDESAPASDDFFGELSQRWEAEAAKAADAGVRVVSLRLGLVLDERGALLRRLKTPFKLFMGGPIGAGRQYMPWIHWRDVIGLVDFVLRTPDASGAINATAPQPVTNRLFSRAFGAALGRPSWLPVPGPVLRLAIGELAKYAQLSQRVVPRRALALGYRFVHTDVETALESLLAPRPVSPPPHAEVGDGGLAPGTAVAAVSTPAVRDTASPGPPARVRLLAVGVNGTLLRSDGKLPQGAVHALRAAKRAECVVVLATARAPRAVRPVLDALELVGPVITYSGAVIWNPVDESAQYHEPLPPELAQQVVETARGAQPDVQIGIEILDTWFTDRIDPALLGRAGPTVQPDDVGPLERYLGRPVTRIDLYGPAPLIAEVRGALANGLWREGQIAVFQPEPTLLQVAHPLADKAIALQRIAQRLGVTREQVMAIGDGPNDVGMLEWAGFGVAVANACSAARRVADAAVESNDQHGVARAVQRFVLGPRERS